MQLLIVAGQRRGRAAGVTAVIRAPRFDELLEEWSKRTTDKQRITGTRVHRQLREEGYEVGSTTVRSYLAEQRRQGQEVFVP